MDQQSAQTEYSFGTVVLNTDRRELSIDGQMQEVEPRVFDLLVYLIQNHSRVVPKAELQEAVWKPAIVTETALTRAVMKARRAVGDDPNEQLIIKTVRGHGYRFVATLTVTDKAIAAPIQREDVDSEEVVPAPQVSRIWGGWGAALTASLLAIAVIALIVRQYYGESPPTKGARIAVLPFVDQTADPELQWASLGLMSYAGKLLESSGTLPTVSPTRVMGLVESLSWRGETEGPVAQDMISRLRSAYGASHIVIAQLHRQGKLLRIQTRVVGPEGQLTEYTAVGEEGTAVTQSIAREISLQLLGRDQGRGDEVEPVSSSDFVNEAYARGMKLELEGRCQDALELYKVALQEDSRSVPLRLRFSGCSRVQGDWEVAESMLRELLDELGPSSDSIELARSHTQLGTVLTRTGRVSEAATQYEAALGVARRLGDEDMSGDILTNWAIVAKSRGDLDMAEALLGRAIVAYNAAGRARPSGSTYSGLANIAIESRKLDEADAYLDLAIASFQEVGDRRREAMMINNRGLVRRHQGRHEEAAVLHEQSLAIREKIGDQVGVGRILGMLSGLYLDIGKYEAARESALRALPISRDTQDALFEGTALSQLGTALAQLGEYDQARENFLSAQQVLAGMEDVPRMLDAELRLADLDRREGEQVSALERAQQVLVQAREAGHELTALSAVNMIAMLEYENGNVDSAIDHYSEVIGSLKDRDWSGLESKAVTRLADIYLDGDRVALAEPLIGQVAQHPDTFSGLLVRARFSAARGQFERAAELMRRAKELAGDRWGAEHNDLLNRYLEPATTAV